MTPSRDNASGAKNNDQAVGILLVDGSDTNDFAGTDTDAGYNAPASQDFNLTSSATLRRTMIELT